MSLFRYAVISCIGRYVWHNKNSFHDWNRFKKIEVDRKPWHGARLTCGV